MELNFNGIIYFIIEILLYLFHLSVLLLLFIRRRTVFKGAFFKILSAVFVADLFCFAAMVVIQKSSLISAFKPFYKESPIFASICLNATAYLTILQFCGHLLMAFNRFTLLWFPLKHKWIWERQWYTFMLICFPFIIICWRLHEHVAFLYLSDTTVTTALTNSEIMALNYIILTTFYLLTTLLTAVLNVLSFMKFYLHKSSTVNVNEKILLVMSFIAMIAQLLRTSYAANKLLSPPNAIITLFFTSILPLLLDIFALSGSISLLVLSSTARREYKSFYFCKMKSATHFTAPSTNLNTRF